MPPRRVPRPLPPARFPPGLPQEEDVVRIAGLVPPLRPAPPAAAAAAGNSSVKEEPADSPASPSPSPPLRPDPPAAGLIVKEEPSIQTINVPRGLVVCEGSLDPVRVRGNYYKKNVPLSDNYVF